MRRETSFNTTDHLPDHCVSLLYEVAPVERRPGHTQVIPDVVADLRWRQAVDPVILLQHRVDNSARVTHQVYHVQVQIRLLVKH